jgi:hypothetical protein
MESMLPTRRPRPAVALPLALALLTACAGDDSGPASVRTDSAGIAIVSYPGPDRPSALTFQEEFRLGGSESDPNQSFYQVFQGTVGVDGQGNLYVLDAPGSRVLVFDGQGQFVRQMGRAGGGPGELGIPAGLVVAEDGTAGVVDFSKRGIVRFDPAGEPLPVQPTPDRYFGGRLVIAGAAMVAPVQQPVGDHPRAETLVRLANADTTMIAFVPPSETKAIQLASCGMGFSGMPPLFSPSLRWDARGSMTAVVTGAAYEVIIYEDGREVRRIRRDIAPVPATEELAVRDLGEAMEVRTEGGVRRCDPAEVAQQRGFAAVIPAISNVTISRDGRLWVLRGGIRDEPKPIDIFSPDGEYEGTLPADSPFPIAFLPDGRIATSEKDELDVYRLVVYTVDRPAVRDRT